MGIWAEIKFALNSKLGKTTDFMPLDQIIEQRAYEENAKLLQSISILQGAEDALQIIPWGQTRIVQDDIANRNIETCLIPETVTRIDFGAFELASYLKGITLPSGAYIGRNAFMECGNLKYINARTLDTIGESAFQDCGRLKEFRINKVTNIGPRAFSTCTALTTVILGSPISYMGEGAFERCDNLTTFIYGGAMSDWYALGGERWFTGSPLEYISCSDGQIDANIYK